MPPKRIKFAPNVDAEIDAEMLRGGTAQSISARLKERGIRGASPATIGRRMRERQGKVNAKRAARRTLAPTPPGCDMPLPERLEDIPEGTGLETYDTWLQRAERMAVDAEIDGDLKALGNAGRLVGFLLEARRKAAPRPVADPNENPDMVKLGGEVAERLHKMVDLVCG